MSLTEQVKIRARELGFDAVGIAPAVPLEMAERAIRERVESGRLKDYGFARRPAESFTRPDAILPGAKSVIVVAMSYLTEEPEEGRGEGPRGKIARFARGSDYHAVVEEKLQQLGKWLAGQTGANYRICVDTGPIIDRAAAREAGIGYYGKNTAIITKEAGSWVVLGELITDVELEYDEPASMEECGDCSVCMRACPSGAIACSFVIDQTKCISHLTQMKGFIPRELRPLIGDRIYGCDVCQEVCPKNILVSPKAAPVDTLLSGAPYLIPLLNISEEEFKRIIGPTAIAWIGRTRFRRNVAIVLGNAADSAAVPALAEALYDSEPVIRAHAAWALGQIGGDEAISLLKEALEQETDARVVEELEVAISQICG